MSRPSRLKICVRTSLLLLVTALSVLLFVFQGAKESILVFFGRSYSSEVSIVAEIDHQNNPGEDLVAGLHGVSETDPLVEELGKPTPQQVSDAFLVSASSVKLDHPLRSSVLSIFPVDSTLLLRMQNSKLSQEEANIFRGKRLVILGDSIDAFILGDILTCPRTRSQPRVFRKPKSTKITCSHLTDEAQDQTIDMIFRGRFEEYDFEVVLHRASYAIEPTHSPPAIYHKSFLPGSRIYNATSMEERYEILLEDSFENLPDMHRADIVLISMNLWLRLHELVGNKKYSKQDITSGLAAYFDVARNFFNPKVLAFHTIPEVKRYGGVRDLNQDTREVAELKGVGVFDWENMTRSLRGKERLWDGMHPSLKLNNLFANLLLGWCQDIFSKA